MLSQTLPLSLSHLGIPSKKRPNEWRVGKSQEEGTERGVLLAEGC